MESSHDCREELRAAGSRATPGRLALLAVLEHATRPLTVEEIARKVRSLNPVTLYRALDALVHAGLVRRGMDGRVTQYQYARKPHHHHMVCVDCGFTQLCRNC